MKRYYFPIFIDRGASSQEIHLNYNWGSLLHGYFMESLPADKASELHKSALKGFSQFVLSAEDCLRLKKNAHIDDLPYLKWFGQKDTSPDGVWSFSLIDDELIESTDSLFSITAPKKIEIKQKNCSLCIGSETFDPIIVVDSFDTMAGKSFKKVKACRKFKIDFLTPTSFKQNGRYVLFPSEQLILQNLIMRWDAFSKNSSLGDDEIFKQLLANTYISSYGLFSKSFSANGIWIKGFSGYLELSIKGPETLANLVNILLSMSAFTGIGIKTALGMGAVAVTPLSNESP